MIDQKARDAEAEIDKAFLRHPLLRCRHDAALFTTLIAADELLDGFRDSLPRTRAAAVDTIINGLKYAIGWLRSQRAVMATNGKRTIREVENAKSFILLAIEYAGISAAYVYGSLGLLNVTLDDRILRVSGELVKDTRYEAYNLLLKPSVSSSEDSGLQHEAELVDAVKKATDRGIKFTAVPTEGAVVAAAYKMIAQRSEGAYSLPRGWTLNAFSTETFRIVHDVISAIVYTWKRIAVVLERLDSDRLAYGPSLPYAITKSQLLSTISDVSPTRKSELRAIIDVLEYGSGGITHPDPVLQPLLPMANGQYLLSAPLVLGSAAERNLTVLVNRLPSEKKAYASLTNDKESAMRERIVRRLPSYLQTWSGRLAKDESLGDVDLALIDPHGVVLLLELKWFIDPAEVREIVDRSKELTKGVMQCRRETAAIRESPSLLGAIPNGPFVDFLAVVVSANWIGLGDVQDPEVPIINEEHLMRKLGAATSLGDVVSWLRSRHYLPTEGIDYKLHSRLTQVDTWQLNWYRLEGLSEDFMPL